MRRGVGSLSSTDAHSTAALGYVALGIGMARRAWLTKDQIVNTRPWSKIEKLSAVGAELSLLRTGMP